MIKFKIIEYVSDYPIAYGSFYGSLHDCIKYCSVRRFEPNTTINIVDYYDTHYVYAYYSTYHKKWIV